VFPTFHAFAARAIYGPDPLVLLGAIYPDIANGLEELTWEATHHGGAALLAFCLEQSEGPSGAALALARGALTHGVEPCGVDYYGDASWPGCERGYMFHLALDYAADAARICGFAETIALWKTHNIVEMAFEIEVLGRAPELAAALVAAAEDPEAMGTASRIIGGFHGVEPGRVAAVLRLLAHRPSADPGHAAALSRRFAGHLNDRFGLEEVDCTSLAGLVRRIHRERRAEIERFIDAVVPLVRENITRILPVP
jgi:hypothetical protein